MKEVESVAVDSVNNPRGGKISSLGSIVLPNDSWLTPQRSQAVDCITCCNWNNGGHLARNSGSLMFKIRLSSIRRRT